MSSAPIIRMVRDIRDQNAGADEVLRAAVGNAAQQGSEQIETPVGFLAAGARSASATA